MLSIMSDTCSRNLIITKKAMSYFAMKLCASTRTTFETRNHTYHLSLYSITFILYLRCVL